MHVASRLTAEKQSVVENGRSHAVVTDLPADQNGTDKGATALELTVMSLAACITTIWAVVAQNSGVSYSDFSVELDAEKGGKTITAVTGRARVVSQQERSKLERTLQKVMTTCPVGLLFEQAGVDVQIELDVAA
jgi:putative redox protein